LNVFGKIGKIRVMGAEFFILLVVAFIIIMVPTNPHDESPKDITRLSHCDIHEWTEKPNSLDDGTYTVCKKCKFLADGGGYEEKLRE
jgi:hypothetical protein